MTKKKEIKLEDESSYVSIIALKEERDRAVSILKKLEIYTCDGTYKCIINSDTFEKTNRKVILKEDLDQAIKEIKNGK